MIKTVKGDLLAVERGLLVHQVNALGIMGGGIALAIKQQFPNVFDVYRKKHIQDGLILGSTIPVWVNEYTKCIVNAVGQKSVGSGRQTSYDALENCFDRVVQLQRWTKEKHGEELPICFPLIGAGLGGGEWSIIAEIIDSVVPDDIEKVLYVI